MLKAGTETGSLINHLYSRSASPKPDVGMGATELCWTDRHAGTIIAVSASGKTVTWQEDTATCVSRNQHNSEQQEWTYERNPQGRTRTFRLTKKGWRGNGGNGGLGIGYREEYYDPSF